MSNHIDEHIHDKQRWVQEAESVINDIKLHVQRAEISTSLPNTNRTIYINFTTLEKKDYCVEISGDGFQIVSEKFDDISDPTEIFYETPYSLLNSISPQFKDSFGNELISKLNSVIANGGEED